MKPSTLYDKIFFSLILCKVYFSIIDDTLQMQISFQGFIMILDYFFFFLIIHLTDIECQCNKVFPLQGMYFDDLLQIYKHKSPL